MKQKPVILVTIAIAIGGIMLYTLTKSLGKSAIDDDAALLFEIPPQYTLINTKTRGGLTEIDFIAGYMAGSDNPSKLAFDFHSEEGRVFFLVNLDEDFIQKKTILKTGTITEQTWRGDAPGRLRNALVSSRLDGNGYSAPESKNLYH